MQRWWDTATVHGERQLYRIHPHVTAHLINDALAGLPREQQTCIDRVRLNQTMTNNQRTNYSHTGSTRCDNCRQPDSAQHRIMECSKYTFRRLEMKQSIERTDQDTPFTYSHLLNLIDKKKKQRRQHMSALGKFLKESGLCKTFIRSLTD